MKIRIVQTEIEEAVRNYILSQIAVKDGHGITMEFTSTRGAEGLIADIDISPVADGSTEQVMVRSTVASTEPVAPREVTKPTPVVAANEPQALAPVAEAPASGGEEPEASAEEEVPGDQPLRKSIFSGMRRPTNGDEAAA